MSEPTRWKDATNAPIGMKELLRAAKPSRAMDEATFMRNADKVAKIAIAPAAAAAISVWAKLAAAGAVIGLATVGTVAATQWRSTPPAEAISVSATHASATTVFQVAPPPAPAPIGTDEAALTTPATPAPTTPPPVKIVVAAPKPLETPTLAPAAASSAASSSGPEEPPRPASTLKEELSLLESAKHDLARSPESSLQKLEAHRARYPSGILSAERDLMALDALRRTGRTQEARDRARAWLTRDPQGIHSARVRQILSTLE